MLPERLAEVAEWLARAEQDLRGAEHLMNASPPFSDLALFHAQQTAEKALKGFLVWHDVVFRRTHDLGELVGQCARVAPAFRAVESAMRELTPFATTERYPGTDATASPIEATQGIASARHVLGLCRSHLPPELQDTP